MLKKPWMFIDDPHAARGETEARRERVAAALADVARLAHRGRWHEGDLIDALVGAHEHEVEDAPGIFGWRLGRCKHCQAVPYRGWWIAAIEWDRSREESMRSVDRQIALGRTTPEHT